MAHKWATWLHNPCRLGGPHRFRAGGRIRIGPQVGKVATQPLPPGGVPTASERGAESEVAHKWATWLHNSCRLGSPPPQSGGQNQKWPTSGQRGYITPAAWGVPTASERGAESEVAHKWAGEQRGQNSIAFGSAPRREVDSQLISPRASKQAVRQIHTVWVFCQWQMRPQAAGRPFVNTSSGRVVMRPTSIRAVGGSNPSLHTFAPPPAAALKVSRPGFEPTPAHLGSAALPLNRWPCYQHPASPLLGAF